MREHDGQAEADGERERRRGSASCRKRSSTFWVTRLGAVTRRRRGGPIWAPPRRRNAYNASVRRLAAATRRGMTQRDARDGSSRAQSIDNRMGQLLLPRSCQQSLPGGGTTHPPAAAPVAVRQTQSAGRGNRAVSRTTPCTRSLVWSGFLSGPPAFRGRHREPSPRAGCGKSACPVR